MPDPIEPSPEVELTTLRKLRDELLARTHTQKARIETLESEALQLTEKADKAVATMRAVTVDRPLRTMVAELNKNIPDLVMRELVEDFSFDVAADGSIVMQTKADNKPVVAKDGKPIEWSKRALHLFLIGDGNTDKTERQRIYTHLLGVPVGSGGAGRKAASHPLATSTPGEKKDAPVAFGLR